MLATNKQRFKMYYLLNEARLLIIINMYMYNHVTSLVDRYTYLLTTQKANVNSITF